MIDMFQMIKRAKIVLFSCVLERYVYICIEWLKSPYETRNPRDFILTALFGSNGTDRKSVGLTTQSWAQGKSMLKLPLNWTPRGPWAFQVTRRYIFKTNIVCMNLTSLSDIDEQREIIRKLRTSTYTKIKVKSRQFNTNLQRY